MSARVLVADGDTTRAGKIEQACAQRGFATRIVHQGAAALEAALAEVPDVVVCQLALPLIDGSRLAGILRANPRTRDAKLVYLGERPTDAPTPGPCPAQRPASLAGREMGRQQPGRSEAADSQIAQTLKSLSDGLGLFCSC